ncbi:hypothetical protein [Pelagibius sp. Alg239-R121]|uniref:WYL domain-containing protein n=1 Tax=Pelagibius sp. Alg239-R121 TaxID=2993448 RepID=UPI0024A779C3|nr:hypothetical protein [Pelagibius sp. Alg239-R121]
MSFDDFKHAQRERLIYLDQCFAWRGSAKRRDLIEKFGVSTAQAALDFKAYLARAGEKAPMYDAALKTYIASPDHIPLTEEVSYGDWESVLRSVGENHFDELPELHRTADPRMIARLNRAIEQNEAIQIRYTSMTTGSQSQQWIAPTRFASDGTRTHLRAYSYKHEEYRDYLPVRISEKSSFQTQVLQESLPLDDDWHTIACISLVPKRTLSAEQVRAVRKEYAFTGKTLRVETRKALEFYADRRWGLDQPNARLERSKTEYYSEFPS